MKKKKIVFLITRFKNAGPINQTLYILKSLNKNIFEPYIISLMPEVENDSIKNKFNEIGINHIFVEGSKISLLTGRNKRLKKILKEINPDIIHSVGMGPYRNSLNYNPEISVTTIRNYFFDDYPAKHGEILGNMLAKRDLKLLEKNEGNICCSESLSRLYYKNHNIKMDFIRNGVDHFYFDIANPERKMELRNKLKLPLNKKIAIYTGQFVERKNQEFAIKSINENNNKFDLFFVFVGDGKNLIEIKEKYDDNPNFLFIGQVNNVKEYLQASDFYFTVSKSEGLPNGVLEAMAVGLPQLLSNIDQHLELYCLNNNIGLVFENGNKQDFNKKLTDLLKADLNKMSLESRKTIEENLSAKKMSILYQRFYLNRIESRRRD